MLDIKVARAFSRDIIVDHIDSRHVIFVKQSGAVLLVSSFKKDSTKIFSVLGGLTAATNSASLLDKVVMD